MTFRRSRALLVSTLAVAVASSSLYSQTARPTTRARMHAIFNSLSTALNLSLYDTPFEAPEDRRMIMDALGVLAENTETLETHGEELNESFDYLRRSLARDANEAILRYRQEQYEGARFVLDQLIENCVSCHSKLPGDGDFDLGRKFVDRSRFNELPAEKRVRLLIGTRQFDRALDLYETHLTSKRTSAQDIAVGGMLGDYLKIALRVKNDPERARRTLAAIVKRRDVTGYLESLITEWIRMLDETDGADLVGAELATARRLVHEARQRNVFPDDRHGLAYFVAASGILQRFLESRPEREDAVTEAYYHLGVCESHTTRSIWVSETEFYLESAVRNSPASPYARLALEFLDAYINSEYTGSGGVMVPEEVQQRLDELRDLVDQAR